MPGSTYRSLWSLSLYPQAGEGGGCLSVRRMVLPSGGPPNVERAAEEAARRARAKIRRYAAANRLNRLGTLTYSGEGCHHPLRLREDLAGFFRALRAGLAAGRFPYLWVPQWHPGGHGLHAHFAVGRFVPRRLIERSWGNGFVHIKLLGGLPVGSGALAEARLAARYLGRYVGREVEDERRLAGLHRYEVAQGFQPAKVECYGRSAEHVIARASAYMGAEPERVWLSSAEEGWRGPPACWAQWG
ncbi:MAG: hypothetical protein M3O89_03765 [Actinomycetota bacterium]|nr:hypothetical protein [Actinomycetota bacterium]